MELLKFSKGNAKLDKKIYTFSIPSGWSCPSANDCLSKADPKTGKITDGKNTKFRCFSASQEALYPSVRKQRWYNFNLLRNAENLSELISKSLPKKAKIIRLHVGGDFYSQEYFDAWLDVAKRHTNVLFYAYTKSLNFWQNRLNSIPDNFKLTASEGGKKDNLITELGLKFAKVVFSEKEAKKLKLDIDHDDSHAYNGDKPFALLLHGVMPKGSLAAKALSTLKKNGFSGYSKKISQEVESRKN